MLEEWISTLNERIPELEDLLKNAVERNDNYSIRQIKRLLEINKNALNVISKEL